MFSSFIYFSWIAVSICPEVVVPRANLIPFITADPRNGFLPEVLRPSQPIRSDRPTAMLAITAEAAVVLIRKYDPSFALDCVMLARSAHIWKNCSAYPIVLPILEVQTLSVVDGVVELLCCRCIGRLIDDVCLLENGEEGEVEGGRLFGESKGEKD